MHDDEVELPSGSAMTVWHEGRGTSGGATPTCMDVNMVLRRCLAARSRSWHSACCAVSTGPLQLTPQCFTVAFSLRAPSIVRSSSQRAPVTGTPRCTGSWKIECPRKHVLWMMPRPVQFRQVLVCPFAIEADLCTQFKISVSALTLTIT